MHSPTNCQDLRTSSTEKRCLAWQDERAVQGSASAPPPIRAAAAEPEEVSAMSRESLAIWGPDVEQHAEVGALSTHTVFAINCVHRLQASQGIAGADSSGASNTPDSAFRGTRLGCI